jgi:hypothetical protein
MVVDYEQVARRAGEAHAHARELNERAQVLCSLMRQLRLVAHGDAMLVRCAWCGRICGDDGRWIAVGDDEDVHVYGATLSRASHGICPDCFADQPAPG